MSLLVFNVMRAKRMCHIRLYLSDIVRSMSSDVEIDSYTTKYILCRLHNEGVKVLTVLLPAFSKMVLESIERGKLPEPSSMSHIAWKKRFPLIFRGLLLEIFDIDGTLRANASAMAIWRIRQFCDYLYKMAFDFEPKDLQKAEEDYLSREAQVASYDPPDDWIEKMRRNLRFYPRFTNTSLSDIFENFRPRYTSGAAYGLDNIQSNVKRILPDDQVGTTSKQFSAFSGYFKAYPGSRNRIHILDSELRRAQLLFVPKDSRGPRAISKEPLHQLRCQMTFFDFAVSTLPLDTNGGIEFLDQSKNQKLAESASVNRRWVTCDLKDASDMVKNKTMKRLFRYHPAIYYFISRTRSTHIELPSGQITPLSKMAGMGSGLTFPMLALYCHLSICTEVSLRTGLAYNIVSPQVHIYGDDVIVPDEWYSYTIAALSRSGLKLNVLKSFRHSHFRESCGGDFYNGEAVKPVRLKLTGCGLPRVSACRDARLILEGGTAILAVERHARELIKSGLVRTADVLYKYLRRSIGELPTVSGESPVLGRYILTPSVIDDTEVTAYVPQAHHLGVSSSCPYKFLGRFFKTSEENRTTQPFGVLAVRYKVNLKRRLVSGVVLRGRPQ